MPKADPNDTGPWEGEGYGATAPPGSNERETLQGIFELLAEVKGVDFSRYRPTTVDRRIKRRMRLSKHSSLSAYSQYLRENPDELKALHSDLLLAITEFFRDPEAFEMLQRQVFPNLVEYHSHKSPIRIWVPGCATGEEVYSLAICFQEFMDEQRVKVPVQFFGADISEQNIAVARAGTYSPKIEKQLSRERLERYFDKLADGYRVAKSIREHCVFTVQDLGSDPPFANVDLISCRNVLIYFDEELQELATSLFYFSVVASGYLLLGPSENLQSFDDLFTPVEGCPNLFRKRVPPARRNPHFPWAGNRARSGISSLRGRRSDESRKSGVSTPEGLAERAILEEYGPPGVLVDSQLQIRQFRGRVSSFLEPAAGSASLKLSKMVRSELMPDLFVAVEEAKRTQATAKRTNVAFHVTPELRSYTDIVVFPLSADSREMFYLVLFEKGRSDVGVSDVVPDPDPAAGDTRTELYVLRRELQNVKHQLQAIIEEKELANQELWTANEEIQSANEELQSVNEEMEAAKEELESANEELVTLNEELQTKNLALSESEARYRGLVESISDWIWETDGKGIVTYSSPRVLNLLGYEANEVVGRSLKDFLPEVWARAFGTPDGGESAFTHEVTSAFHRLGNKVTFDTSCVPKGGAVPNALRGVSRDVSERVRASLRLQRSEQSLELAQEIAKLGHWELDLVGEDHLWSTQMFRMFDFPEAERPPAFREFLDIVHPEDRAAVIDHVKLVAGSGIKSRHEWRTNPLNGPPRVFEAQAIPVRNADGVVHKLLGTLLDITEKRRAEAELRDIASRFEAYVQAAPDAILVLNEAGQLQEVNDSAVLLLGRSKETQVGRHLLDFVGDEDRARFDAEMAGLMKVGRFSGEFAFVRPDRSVRLTHLEGVKLSPARFLVFAKDVTEHKAAEAALRAAQENLHHAEKMQAIGQLAGGVAHDFNNQLTTVLAFSELLRQEVQPDPKLTAYCDQIMAGIKRASDLTAQLLAYSRKGKYQSVHIDLHYLVDEVCSLLQRTIDKKVDVRLDLRAPTSATVGDPTQLQNVLLNLALNARDAMPDGGTLTISTRVVEESDIVRQSLLGTLSQTHYIEVCVADTGVGMTADVLGRIFEPFFSTKAPGKGLGMGLPSVYGAVVGHNGAIRVESEPGRGSAFYVYLPASEVQAVSDEQPVSLEVVPKRSARIIVVEDEPTLRVAVCTVLTHLGHVVKGFTSGRDAIAYYRDHWADTDLVILDMIMPVMNGKETFLALKAVNPDVVALVASGYSLETETEEILRSGVRGFLQKPFKMEDLAKGVTEVLSGQSRTSRNPTA